MSKQNQNPPEDPTMNTLRRWGLPPVSKKKRETALELALEEFRKCERWKNHRSLPSEAVPKQPQQEAREGRRMQ